MAQWVGLNAKRTDSEDVECLSVQPFLRVPLKKRRPLPDHEDDISAKRRLYQQGEETEGEDDGEESEESSDGNEGEDEGNDGNEGEDERSDGEGDRVEEEKEVATEEQGNEEEADIDIGEPEEGAKTSEESSDEGDYLDQQFYIQIPYDDYKECCLPLKYKTNRKQMEFTKSSWPQCFRNVRSIT